MGLLLYHRSVCDKSIVPSEKSAKSKINEGAKLPLWLSEGNLRSPGEISKLHAGSKK